MYDEPARAPDRTAITRGRALRSAAVAAGGALAAVSALGRADRGRAAPSDTDVRALNLLLLVERAEVAFYAAALEGATFGGELKAFARAVLAHEEEHVAYLEGALGDAAERAPEVDFAAHTGNAGAFARASARLEDVAVGAYNGQAAEVSPGAFLAAARIVSVEARHAAWIRSIRDDDPAPDAVDSPYDERRVRRELRALGVTA